MKDTGRRLSNGAVARGGAGKSCAPSVGVSSDTSGHRGPLDRWLAVRPDRSAHKARVALRGHRRDRDRCCICAYVRVVERRPVRELALRGAPAEFGAGFLLGAALFAITIGIIWSLGDYAIVGVNHWTAILSPLGFGLAAGVLEEILFRGVIFRITAE